MAIDDYIETEVAVAVAATSVVLSPRVRGVLYRGAVYGVAGVIIAKRAVSGAAGGVGSGVRQAAGSAGEAVQGAVGRVRGSLSTGSGS